ncbi:MAG: sulfatase/phosphatase domain-containing protein, partial [Pseudomonadota bacterium]
DIVPTLLEAAGIDRPEGLDGRSLVPLVNRTDMAWPESVFMQISEAQVGRSLRTERWKYSVEAPLADAKADPGADEYREEFLYDLRADPHELTNLIGLDAFDEIASQLRQQLVDQIRDVEGRSVTITPAPTRLSGQRSPSIR